MNRNLLNNIRETNRKVKLLILAYIREMNRKVLRKTYRIKKDRVREINRKYQIARLKKIDKHDAIRLL